MAPEPAAPDEDTIDDLAIAVKEMQPEVGGSAAVLVVTKKVSKKKKGSKKKDKKGKKSTKRGKNKTDEKPPKKKKAGKAKRKNLLILFASLSLLPRDSAAVAITSISVRNTSSVLPSVK